MRLSPLKYCLISTYLWNVQAFAEDRLGEAKEIAKPKIPGFGFEESLDQESPLEAEELVTETEEERIRSKAIEHSLGLWQEDGQTGLIEERGLYRSKDTSLGYSDLKSLNWDLGFGEDYSHRSDFAWTHSRTDGHHTPRLGIFGGARLFQGSGGSLEEIYQGAYRSQKSFVDFNPDASQSASIGLNLGDRIKLSSRDSLDVSVEGRGDRSYIPDAFDDLSQYQAISAQGVFGEGRSQKTRFLLRRSSLRYQDQRNKLETMQGVTEAEASFFQKVSPRQYLGFGIKTYDGERSGPVLTWQRVPDARGEAEGKLSYLKGSESDQLLGSFNGRYLWTRQLALLWNLEQGIDLLASYTALPLNGQRDIQEQKITKVASLAFQYTLGETEALISAKSNQQNFQNSEYRQEDLVLKLTQSISRWDLLMTEASYRHLTEEGKVFREQDRRAYAWQLGWRHRFTQSSRLMGAEYFSEFSLGNEKLWEGDLSREKKAFRIAIGQEWR